jgi:hypothetical protein
LWQSLEFIVDLECGTQNVLELVASAVVATIQLHPRWYAGNYRVWFSDFIVGWKVKIGVYYDYNDTGTAS